MLNIQKMFFFFCCFNVKNGPSKSKRLYVLNYLEELCLFYCSQSNFTLQIIFIYSDRACNVRNVCFPSTGPIVICRCRWPMFTRDHSLDCSETLSLHLYALISVRVLREVWDCASGDKEAFDRNRKWWHDATKRLPIKTSSMGGREMSDLLSSLLYSVTSWWR